MAHKALNKENKVKVSSHESQEVVCNRAQNLPLFPKKDKFKLLYASIYPAPFHWLEREDCISIQTFWWISQLQPDGGAKALNFQLPRSYTLTTTTVFLFPSV